MVTEMYQPQIQHLSETLCCSSGSSVVAVRGDGWASLCCPCLTESSRHRMTKGNPQVTWLFNWFKAGRPDEPWWENQKCLMLTHVALTHSVALRDRPWQSLLHTAEPLSSLVLWWWIELPNSAPSAALLPSIKKKTTPLWHFTFSVFSLTQLFAALNKNVSQITKC